MTTVLISEHYRPRIGGVTTFIERLSVHLPGKSEYVLLVPGNNREGEVFKVLENGIEVYYFGMGIDLTGNISPDIRINFCHQVSEWILTNTEKKNITVVHVLFGLYLMKYLKLSEFDKLIFRSCTIHNLPPQETALSWKGDAALRRLKDWVRRKGVKRVNEHRIKAQKWDKYVVPSSYVSMLLSKLVPANKIEVIGHGVEMVQNNEKQKPSDPVKLLTVSGITPHKRLHKVTEVVEELNSRGVRTDWEIVGPIKNERYYTFIHQQIVAKNLSDQIRILHDVDDKGLERIYKSSDIYVHLSKEEGFCLAFLEALTFGLPAIGYDTGAIAKMVREGRGLLVNDSESSISNAIQDILASPKEFGLAPEGRDRFKEVFSWKTAGEKYTSMWETGINSVDSA